MAPKDYFAIIEGYNNKQRRKAELLRKSVWAAKSTWEGSIAYVDWSNRFFPLWFDKIIDEKMSEITDEAAEEIIQRHRKYHRKITQKRNERSGSNEYRNRGAGRRRN